MFLFQNMLFTKEFAKLCAFRPYVPYVPQITTCLCACVPVPEIPTCLHAYVPYVRTCLRRLRIYMPLNITCLRAYVLYVPAFL